MMSALPKSARTRLTVLDWALLIATLFFAAVTTFLRFLGPAAVMAFAVLCGIYILLRGKILWNGVFLSFTLVGIFYFFLSFYHLLPIVSEGHYFSDSVLRMGYFVFLLYPVTSAYYHFWRRAIEADVEVKIAKIAFCVTFAASFIPLALDRFIPSFGRLMASIMYGFDNKEMLLMWSATFLAFMTRSYFFLIMVLFMCVTGGSSQLLIAAMLLLLFFFVRFPVLLTKLAGSGIIFGLPIIGMILVGGGWIVAYNGGIQNELGGDVNMAQRALWWMSTFKAALETFGVGSGFGADGVPYIDKTFISADKLDRLPVVVPHNDFVYLFLATGFVGGILMLVFFFRELMPRVSGNRMRDAHAGYMFCIVALASAVNPALLTPTYIAGLCWVYAYLLVNNKRVVHEQLRSAAGDIEGRRHPEVISSTGQTAFAGSRLQDQD